MHTERQLQSTTSFALSSEEVLHLLENHNSTQALLGITKRIADSYGQSSLKASDTQAAEQIFRLLIRETETHIRAALSQHIKNSKILPRDIALTLAQDVEEVALPILEYSQVLTESDLIELVQSTRDHERYLALSRRDHVPEKLSDILITHGNEEIASSLVHNIGADISENGLNQLVTRFPENKPLMSSLVSRPHLSAAIAEKLIHHVSDSLARTLKQKHHLPNQDINKEVEETRETETLKLIRITRAPEEIERLISHLMTNQRLTPSLILTGLSQGNFAFFETALARLSHITVINARALIRDRGDLGFRALYNKSGLPENLFPAVRLLLHTVCGLDTEGKRPGSARYATHVVERLLNAAQTTPVENLSYIIALVRRSV